MATKAQTMSTSLRTPQRTSQGLFGQITTVLIQPKAFFRRMPQGRQWLWVAGLILIMFGFAASNQTQTGSTGTTTSTTSSSSSSQSQNFDLSMFQTDTSAQTTDTTASAQVSAAQTTTEATDMNTTLMSALLTGCGVLAMWAGQVLLLSFVPMLSGRAPKLGRSLHVAVWASLPLALMLALRQVYFAAGGTGGAVGLSLLMEEWDGYADLSRGAQRLVAAFLSTVSLFWLWSLVLLYCGARYALNGRRWVAILVVLIWIVAVPSVTALVSDPVTTVSPRASTGSTSSTSSSSSGDSSSANSTTVTQPMDMSGFMGGSQTGGQMPSGGGQPPSGGGMGPGG